MMDSVSTFFSRDETGVTSITFNQVSQNEIQWGTCSLTLSATGQLTLCINNNFQNPSVVFGQISMIAKAMDLETTALVLSVKSVPEIDQRELSSFLPIVVRDLRDLTNQIEAYFVEAVQMHFEWDAKECTVKNRHVHIKGSTGSFSIPFTMLIEIIAKAELKQIQVALHQTHL